MTNTFRAIFETFDQSDKKTWPDQQKDNKNTPHRGIFEDI